ncbi:hypothetical protein [Pseudoalteromonas sp. MMG012]|uniref:hypothetical protein n=1 Tax=Pseudoalteromonas sp. MMG012 TaxID=2822686 RepID=UPI001B3A5AF2|nr:hypothetical protein [Pseudoalteromonas sp. MMG012]MBQ4852469.1 hypothetical protein [Pseudoalteromonas sp. MMG012]
MVIRKRNILFLCNAFILSACSFNQNPEGSYSGGDRVNMAGAAQLLPPNSFVTIDLPPMIADMTRVELITAMHEKLSNNGTNNGSAANNSNSSKVTELLKHYGDYDVCTNESDVDEEGCILARAELNFAIKEFYSGSDEDKRQRIRNTVQDRIVAASIQRCNVYKIYMKRVESRNNFWLGSVTTLLGGAGAMFTSESASRVLAGLAGVTSGVRAEFNQAYLANQATELIAKGIDLKRDELKSAMQQKNQQTLDSYSLYDAIGDAISFHGACSILTGLEVAGKAVDNMQDPGFNVLAKNLYKSKHLEEVIEGVSPADFKYAELANQSSAASDEILPKDMFMRVFVNSLSTVKDDFNNELTKLVADKKMTAARQTAIAQLQDSQGILWQSKLDTRLQKHKANLKAKFEKLKSAVYFVEDSKSKPQEVKLAEVELKIVLQTLELFNNKVKMAFMVLHDAKTDLQNDTELATIYTQLHDAIPESL